MLVELIVPVVPAAAKLFPRETQLQNVDLSARICDFTAPFDFDLTSASNNYH